MECTIKVLSSKKDVSSLVRRKLNKSDFNMMLFQGWLNDEGTVKAYCLYGDNGLFLAIALMSKCDFDPLGTQTNPMVLNYIFTLKNFRRNGYGGKLLEHVKSNEEFTAFASSDESEAFFDMSGCDNLSEVNNTIMFRWPCKRT